jgi:hypothetical protein
MKAFKINTNFFFVNNRRKTQSLSLEGISKSWNSSGISNPPQVWALDCSDRLLAIGCSDGRVEVWDVHQGILKVLFYFCLYRMFMSSSE